MSIKRLAQNIYCNITGGSPNLATINVWKPWVIDWMCQISTTVACSHRTLPSHENGSQPLCSIWVNLTNVLLS